MSSSYIVEPQEGTSKKDDTLILMVNDNGVISVDQDTLQNLILNQSNASVSVVRLGQMGNDTTDGNITLTVDPPAYAASEPNVTQNTSDSSALVDPFMEMDPEQLEKLETALQSEEAKHILGENVTAMLDMLTVEEQQNSIRYSIELDHCYTSRFSPSQPKPADPLPDTSLSDIDDSINNIDINKVPHLLSSSSININSSMTPVKQKVTSIPPKIVKQPLPVGGRPRRASSAMQPVANNPKSTVSTNARTIVTSQENTKDDEKAEDEIFSPSESSETEDSGSDSDFGPRNARRGVRARGGRRGLTTRGGSMSASRRRGSSKHMDSEQVRRLNLEMAAAVNAMKSPEKEDKLEKHSPVKNKKTLKTLPAMKKEDVMSISTSINEIPPVETNVLQTTNQVKANLINANMFKGDMILTKPGQDRSNQKVVFIQKQVSMNPNEIKSFGIKKQVMIPKNKLISTLNSKVSTVKEVKTTPQSSNTAKVITPMTQVTVPQNISPVETIHSQTHSHKVPTTSGKSKSIEVKKEKKKIDVISEIPFKAVDSVKATEAKTPAVPKKIIKKDYRKSETLVVEALGPALFSTPDIIRRVGSTDSKIPENSTTTTTISNSNSSGTTTIAATTGIVSTLSTFASQNIQSINDQKMDANISDSKTNSTVSKHEIEPLILSETLGIDKLDEKAAIVNLLHPALESAPNPSSSKESSSTMEDTNDTKSVSETGIEGDDQLLDTLGIEATKQLPNDEELLAEALLLQETLGVDLDNNGLVESTSEVPETILSPSMIEPQPSLPVVMPMIKLESTSSVETFNIAIKNESINKKDTKESNQIIRGGRVITLPPIEAPATRSKSLQSKVENQVKVEKKTEIQQQPQPEPVIIKSERTSRAPSHVSLQKQDMIYDMEYDDEEEEPISDSEDDPNRLWCICRQPHNNRFMICCDMCQDWFHGKCVHVTKAMGEQMEHDGIEWVCPNCLKKKNEENKSKSLSKRQRNSTDSTTNERRTSISNSSITNDIKITPNSIKNAGGLTGITQCVVCKKEARKSSIFCSDACIWAHAEVTSTKPSPSSQIKTSKLDVSKIKSEARIIVYDKKTGKVLTGADAPLESNLKTWLKDHPTYEVVKSNNLNTIQIGGKTVAAIQTQGVKTNKQLQSKSPVKMVFSKVPGSKQTVLAPNTKKALLLTDAPARSVASSQSKPKQALTPGKSPGPGNLKQTFIKSSFQQQQYQQIPQKPIVASLQKTSSLKKPQEAKASTSQQQQQQQPQETANKTPPPKKPDAEPIRLNIKKTLAEHLTARIKEAQDLKLTEDEIIELAAQIELEMFKYFKDTGAKYKSKYRSLLFNIKDPKNLTLFRKIADHSLTPEAVVKLSPEEMASQELAEWREKENKHQLEMIKKNELDLMAQAKSIVVKTHKGEQIIENDGAIETVDLKTPVQDIVSALNNSSMLEEDSDKQSEDTKKSIGEEDERKRKKKEKDRDREKRRDRSRDKDHKRDRSRSKSRHRHKNRERSRDRKSKKDGKHRDRSREKDHDKSRDKKKDKDKKHKRSRSNSRSKTSHKDKHKKDDEKKKDTTKYEISISIEKPIEDRLWRHIEDETTTNTLDGNESDISDREPSSTVTIKTPDINDELERELDVSRIESKLASDKSTVATVWRGSIFMTDVAKFRVTAQNVSGNSKELMEGLPEMFDVVGRISPNIVWDYISKMKKNLSKEIMIVRLTAINDEEMIPYITLYSYLNSRNRFGVVGCEEMSPFVKDFYIMPFPIGSKLPSVLLPLDGPGFSEEIRHHLLLGIIVANSRRKRTNAPPPLTPIPTKIAKRDQQQLGDRSYTPPPPLHLLPAKDESTLLPDSPRSQVRMLSQETKQYSVISKIVPELSSKLIMESSSSSDKMQNDDDDEPYSPGEPVDITLDDEEDALSSSSSLKVPQLADISSKSKCSSELQRKMDELSRQIEEEKMQIKTMSSSFLSDSLTLPGLGLDPPDSSDATEAYSPSDTRSFTPPPQGSMSKLAQPILEKVSNITIPPNLQEILANVKRQENSKVDPYLPSKPGATFLTVSSSTPQSQEKYSMTVTKSSTLKLTAESSPQKEPSKSTLSSLSDYDLMKKAEEELAALAAVSTPIPSNTTLNSEPPPPGT